MKVNYHTHCHFCDGKGDPENYVKEAINRGFSVLGFSSHAPIKEKNDWTMTYNNIDEYFSRISQLKEAYKDKLTIHTGLEIDYYPDENRFEHFKKFNTEFTIGSVHMVKPDGFSDYFSVDESEETFRATVTNIYNGSVEAFGRDYFKALRGMIEQGGFNILGHLDLFKKFNKGETFFLESDSWYKDEIAKTVKLLSGKDIIVEVNTGAISRGVQDTPYPSKWILEMCNKEDIKVCLNSDVHGPENIECFFPEALKMIKSCGYNKLTTPFEEIDI